ncbi:hypothetical protein Tco_0066332 [Tanacetum coccineum]
MVMPYESAFSKVLHFNDCHNTSCSCNRGFLLAVPEQTTVETVTNMTPENRAHFESKKEAIHLILTGIGVGNISTVVHVQTAQELWIQEWDTTLRYKNAISDWMFGNQRAVNVVGARETVGGPVERCCCVNKETGVHFKQSNLTGLTRTDEEIDEQELEAHYSYMAKIQEVPSADSGTDVEPLEQVQYDTDDNVFANAIQHFDQSEYISNTCAVEMGDSNVTPESLDMCDNDIQGDQNDVECDDERVALANLIANLKLDVGENKKIQKQLKKTNATLTQELTECKSILAETSRTLGESNSIQDSCLVALQNKQTEFERYKAFNDCTVDYDKLERRLNETLGLLAQKEISQVTYRSAV